MTPGTPSRFHRAGARTRIGARCGAGDFTHVTFEIVDAHGTVAPTHDDEVRFTVTGGEIVALDNGDLRDHTPYRTDRKRAFNGRGLAIIRATAPGE
jgi:beta-galactosidase